MTIEAEFLEEPLLEFGNGQTAEHPQDGLFLYGPSPIKGGPEVVRVGLVGTEAGIALVKEWLPRIAGRIPVKDIAKLHTSNWPGFQAAFGARLETEPLATIAIKSRDIEEAAHKKNRTEAVRGMVKLYEDAIVAHLRNEETRPEVWVVIVPEVVHDFGRPEVKGPKDGLASNLMPEKLAKRFLSQESMFPEMNEEAQTYLFAKNFHHQLKAQLLDKEVVIQILRETTIEPNLVLDRFDQPKRSVQESAKIAWNFSTTLFFKARGQPWQLANVRPGVAYVGLVFKKDQSPAARGEACCAAQMFLNSGNGVVFRGALGPWYSEKTREFHLSQKEAASLIENVVKTYQKDHGAPPTELFIHGRQRFSEEEWAGFMSSVPSETKLVGVRIKPSNDLRLFRALGSMPILRGTVVKTSRKNAYLWTTGYVPRLRTYAGFETPKPIQVEICHGEGDLTIVLKDVLALTKVNYNACEFASGLPVTLKFADRVGEILTASPHAIDAPPLPFRFYI